MQKEIILTRDCKAMLIPSGLEVTLAKGNNISITHTLGGKFTVRGVFGIARIDECYADAIGASESSAAANDSAAESDSKASEKPSEKACTIATASANFPKPTENDLWEIAKTVFDPEIPVNVVDLGLVYRIELLAKDDGNYAVECDMTLTAPGCAMGPAIANDLKMRLESVPSIAEAQVNIVWDPPWNSDMMSQEARMILGLE